MSTYKNYKKRWLSPFYGVKPHTDTNDSFNDVLFSAELILAKKELGELDDLDKYYFRKHIDVLEDENGLYSPKNSHDNLTGKLSALRALGWSDREKAMSLKHMVKGKHPRDIIMYGFLKGNGLVKYLCLILMPLVILDMFRAVFDVRVRPAFTEKKFFWFRVKAMLGLLEFKERKEVRSGYHMWYKWGTENGGYQSVRYTQNDGKILNLLRLNMLREYFYFKPIVRLFKMLYNKRMGKDFQTQLFESYFIEKNHPVTSAFRELDRLGKTIIDC